MERSHCYNPFVYLKSDNDIQRLVTNLFKNTTPKGSQTQDPFWDQAATMLLLALIFLALGILGAIYWWNVVGWVLLSLVIIGLVVSGVALLILAISEIAGARDTKSAPPSGE
jgi:hypothetical protein